MTDTLVLLIVVAVVAFAIFWPQVPEKPTKKVKYRHDAVLRVNHSRCCRCGKPLLDGQEISWYEYDDGEESARMHGPCVDLLERWSREEKA